MSLKTVSRREKNDQTDTATCAAGKPERLNLGCGTLVVLFILIATAGKLLPHRENPPRTEKNTGETAITPQPRPSVETRETSARARSAGDQKSRTSQPSRAANESGAAHPEKLSAADSKHDGYLTAFVSTLERYVAHYADLAAGSGAAARSAARPASGSPQFRQGREVSHGNSADQVHSAESQSAEPESSPLKILHAEHPVNPVQQGFPKTGSSGSDGKPLVFNSPWDNSVEQVYRYLKRHTHDADSVQVLEWGKVKPTNNGYQVRCTFKSKNVLGNVATLNKLFLLDKDGEVTDIRD